MARGQQKLQSQAKAQEKQAKQKKQQGHSATAQKKAAQKALVHVCSVCKVCLISGNEAFVVCGECTLSFLGANARPKNLQTTFRE